MPDYVYVKLRDSEEVDRGYWSNQGFLNVGDEITSPGFL